MWANMIFFLKPNPINHHLVVFFFISKNFIEPLSTDIQRDHSHRMYLGKSPVHSHRPKQKFYSRADWDLPLQPGCRVPHRAQPAATQGWALCGWKDGARVWKDRLGPLGPFTCQ